LIWGSTGDLRAFESGKQGVFVGYDEPLGTELR
jgi:hypothetical protein